MMKQGFTLLEIMIATLIAGLISVGLLTTIFQINKTQRIMYDVTSQSGRAAIFQHQFERDMMGAFVPTQVDVIQTSTLKKSPVKPLEKVFYSKNKERQLDVLSFITDSPMQVYTGIKNVKPKPRVARVVYRLVPDGKRKNSYVLTRQEGISVLSFDNYSSEAQGDLRPYRMIDGIERLMVQYIAMETKTEDDEKKTVKHIYKTQKEWLAPKKAEVSTNKPGQTKTEPITLPHFVKIELGLWDVDYKKSKTFAFTVPVVGMSGDVREQKKEQPKEEKKDQEASKEKAEPKKETTEKSPSEKTTQKIALVTLKELQ